jgi:hypothetical protein
LFDSFLWMRMSAEFIKWRDIRNPALALSVINHFKGEILRQYAPFKGRFLRSKKQNR